MRLPEEWRKNWQDPPLYDLPLQIIHGIPSERANVEGMKYYKDLGLGGIVCNIDNDRYMQSEKHWQILNNGVEACNKLGLNVWIYDEDGYPSGSAGGLILKKDPSFEATELAYNEKLDDPFIIRPAYEYTHASNNYYAYRRYINLIDNKAVKCFIETTHEKYRERIEKYFNNTIKAFFTDEPSLMAVNLGALPENVRDKVRIVDPLDDNLLPLPCVPWSSSLVEEYYKRYGEDLISKRRSLFTGKSEEDKRIRRQFWEIIADLVAKNYFGQIQDWCVKHHIKSSGHTLREEQIIDHIALEGNALKALSKMDIPGLDLLSSEPIDVFEYGWLTAGLPCSASILSGRRRVMTEVSDFDQKMSSQEIVNLSKIQATAAWQLAWGVTDFTLYYNIQDRGENDHRKYCDYVGRLNTILKYAQPVRKVLLYYPIYDLWTEYIPVAESLTLESQSGRTQRIVKSFIHLGSLLQRAQIPFTLIDHEYLNTSEISTDGKLKIKNNLFDVILIPEDVELPSNVNEVLARFRKHGGIILRDTKDTSINNSDILIKLLRPEFQFSPHTEKITIGCFVRDDRKILLIVNTSKDEYDGHLLTNVTSNWLIMNPSSGEIQTANKDKFNNILLKLKAFQSILLVEDK